MPPKRNRASNRAELIAAISIAVLMVSAGVWVFARPQPPVDEAFEAIVIDVSPTASPESRCGDLARIAASALGDHRGVVHATIYTTGDRASGDLPRVGAVERQPQRALMEQHDSGREQHELLGRFAVLCAAAATRQESPIFRAVAAAVATMAGHRCLDRGRRCRVWVRTDGLEEEDAAIIARLRGKTRPTGKAGAGAGAITPRIDNHGIDIVFCNIGQRTLGRKARRSPALADVEAAFRPEFTSPERVRFAPSCEPEVTDGVPTATEQSPRPARAQVVHSTPTGGK